MHGEAGLESPVLVLPSASRKAFILMKQKVSGVIFRRCIFTVSVLAAMAMLLSAVPARAALNVGDRAPSLVVTDMAGVKVDLSDMQGKTVIVGLWSLKCEPCRAEIPMLRDFYHKYEDMGVKVIALNIDRPRDRKAVERVAARVDYHVAMASDASANGFSELGAAPAVYIIDKDGTVSAVLDDKPMTEKQLMTSIADPVEIPGEILE
jgi:peroxiredoxin